MGREVRRVPADWQHPKDENGNYIPLCDGFNSDVARWDEERDNWDSGLMRNLKFPRNVWVSNKAYRNLNYIEWNGERPVQSDYMPDWPKEQRTHYQMYENVSEGTPISPVVETLQDLARWLADNGVPPARPPSWHVSVDSLGSDYDEWLSLLEGGTYTPDMELDWSKMRWAFCQG